MARLIRLLIALASAGYLVGAGLVPASAAPAAPRASPGNGHGGLMTWHGGRLPGLDAGVLLNPRLYLSFWGPTWASGFTDAGGYPASTAMTYLTTFAAEIGGSAWAQTLTQYCVGVAIGATSCPGGAGSIQNPPGQLAGTWIDSTPVPNPLIDPQLSTSSHTGPIAGPDGAVLRAVGHFGWDPNGLYAIILPAGADPDWFPYAGCAYHSAMGTGPSQPTAFAVIPYQPDSARCGRNSAYRTNDAFGHGWFDGLSGALGHEYAEAITDFNAQDGWSEDGLYPQGEIGDKCGPFGPATLGAHGFAVPYLWSNAVTGCLLQTVTGGPPGAPTNLAGAPAAGQVTLSWTAPPASGGTPISGYTVTVSPSIPQSPITFNSPATTELITGLSNGTAYTFMVTAINAAGPGGPSSPSPALTPVAPQQFPGGPFSALVPYRALDTRPGAAQTGGSGTLGAGQTITVGVAVGGTGRVPTSATGVVLNVTVVAPAGSGYLTVWPAGSPKPLASSLNFSAGQVIANLVEVPVGPGGAVSIYNGSSGLTDVLADVAGYTAAGGDLFNPLAPTRLLDTRTTAAALAPSETRLLAVGGLSGVPPAASGVILNVTVTNPSLGGFLTVWPAGQPQPVVSNLNFGPGQTVPNRVQVQLGVGGALNVYNLAGSSDVIVDLNGYFTNSSGSAFTGVAPTRILDTRITGLAVGPAATITIPIFGGPAAVPASAKAVVLNLTAVVPSSAGFLTVWPAGAGRPVVSDLNFTPGQVVSNLVVVSLGGSGVGLYNSGGLTDIVVDVAGWYS